MPRIGFCFSGYVNGANVTTVRVNKTGQTLDVSHRLTTEIVANLQSGRWSIVLGDFLYSNRDDAEIEFSDFQNSI